MKCGRTWNELFFIIICMHLRLVEAQKECSEMLISKTFYRSKMLIININCNKFYQFEVYYAKKKSNNVY